MTLLGIISYIFESGEAHPIMVFLASFMLLCLSGAVIGIVEVLSKLF